MTGNEGATHLWSRQKVHLRNWLV